MKNILRVLIIIIVLAAVASAAAVVVAARLNHSPEKMPEETVFRVNKGDTAVLIGKELQQQGLIRSSDFFHILVKIKNTAEMMKSGLYRIKGGSTTLDIHNLLLLGSEELFNVTIPPGLASSEIAEILEANEIVQADDFILEVKKRSAEGFLFPDTYKLPKDYPADKIVSLMIETFEDNALSVYPQYKELSHDELMQAVIMASVIEREYRVADEASKIASVFYNRIEQNMYLGSCATVVYVITEELGREHPERLLYRDLDIESPFNTYRNKGLPPAPISNPGRVAIDAAFNPDDTDYLYFLLEDPEAGTHFFSKSLAEHNKSYELYIKGK